MFNSVLFNEELFAPGVGSPVPVGVILIKGCIPTLRIECKVYSPTTTISIEGYAPASPVEITLSVANITIAGRTPSHIYAAAHAIVSPLYRDLQVKPNKVYIVGIDRDGNMVYGSASDTTINGEILHLQLFDIVTSFDDAGTIAENVLANTRLQVDRGNILIPPNCGMELWDVIEIDDDVCNQDHTTYRVNKWRTRYSPNNGTFVQIVGLTSV